MRPPASADFRAWADLRDRSRAFLAPWEPTWAPDALSENTYQRRLRRQAAEWRADEAYNFHVFDRRTGQLVGGIGLTNVHRGVAQMGSLGYWIGDSVKYTYLIPAVILVSLIPIGVEAVRARRHASV